jgi:phospholipase A1
LKKAHFVLLLLSLIILSPTESYAIELTPEDARKIEAESVEVPSISLVEAYNPMYFLIGQPDTKIRLSIKWKIWHSGDTEESHRFFFGYSQQMLWELLRNDPYMRDVNYNPDFFYRYSGLRGIDFIDLGLFEHESNGRGGINERSWNRTYLRFQSRVPVRIGNQQEDFSWSIKGWAPYAFNPSNTDLPQYRGYWEAELALFDMNLLKGNQQVILRLYPGGAINFRNGGQEITLKTSLPRNWGIRFYFTAQIFHGYAETLLNYNESNWGARFGFGF